MRLCALAGLLGIAALAAADELPPSAPKPFRLEQAAPVGRGLQRRERLPLLQRDLGLTEEDAYLTIQRQSRQRRKSKKEIAEAIILGDDLRRGKSPS